MAAWIVASFIPAIIRNVPSQANNAAENVAANVPSSILSGFLYLGCVILSLVMGWGLTGVAAGIWFYIWVELVLRLVQVLRWVRKLPESEIPGDVRRRMTAFSGHGTALLLLNVVVWDRSDILFLKVLGSDIRQVAFFSVAFNLAEKLLLVPNVFGQAIGVSLMAQYGRDEKRLLSMVSNAALWMFFCAAPVLLGGAVLSGPVIRVLYGHQYLRAIPVLVVVAIFALPKSLLLPAQHLLQTTEHQKFLVIWGCVCAVVNIVLDLALIPPYGMIGAAVANGGAQTLAMIGIWIRATQLFPLRIRWGDLARILGAALAMSAVVFIIERMLPSVFAIVGGVVIGAAVYFVVIRLTGALQPQDVERLCHLGRSLPGTARPYFDRLVRFLLQGGKAQWASF